MYKQELFPVYHHTDDPTDVPGGPGSDTLGARLEREPSPEMCRVVHYQANMNNFEIRAVLSRKDGLPFPRHPKPADKK